MKKLQKLGLPTSLMFAGTLAIADHAAAQGSVPDAAINSNVQAQFVAHGVNKVSNMTVTTANGLVTLTGTVYSLAAEDEALNIAKRTPGVTSVNDQLAIDEVPDAAILAEIKNGFGTHGVAKVANIAVASVRGVVTLSGTANSLAAKDEAGDVAKKVHGVRRVINNVAARP